MQSRDEFVAQRKARWEELDGLLAIDRPLYRRDAAVITRVAALYRAICSDLMRARSLGFAHDLVDYLNRLASRAHNALYGPKPFSVKGVFQFLLAGFPRTFRKNWRPMLLSSVLFYLPLLLSLAATVFDKRFALNVLSPEMLEQMAEAYSVGFADGRSVGQDSSMAGFYVYNNVGIAFRCFATGILFGAGSLFFILYNGVVLGAVFGYVIASGHGVNILTFCCGHGPFELTAIAISGGAGLKMGYSLIATGGLTRLGSLRSQMGELAELIMGAAVMLLIAAAVEAFWSPSSLPNEVKWAFSFVVSVLLVAYFALAGRRSDVMPHRSPKGIQTRRLGAA